MISYGAFLAEIYDSSPFFGQGRFRELERFNAPYFRHLEGETETILEFGSGTGLLTVPLARRGFRTDSVDISPHMHDILARKLNCEDKSVAQNVNQILADATTFESPATYRSIVMPEGILIALPDRNLQLALLKSCHRNLAPGGRLYSDFFQPRYDLIHQNRITEFTRFRTPDGRSYLMTIELTNDRYTQVQRWNVTYVQVEAGEKVNEIRVEVDFRYLFSSEIQLMLELCGFRTIEFDTDYADGRGFFLVAEKR